MKSNRLYLQPIIDVIEVETEQGFTVSPNPQELPGYEDGGDAF
ncbi:hypothetical protein [uncultured Alistipes sp.]|nr:hypothetical protein [uncultured Alistipes sp.]